MVQKNLISNDTVKIESLPIFETQGGKFCVPLLPESARILAPDEDWAEALRPDFSDFLVSFEGDAGEFMAEVGRDRGSETTFLAEFVASRVGMFSAPLCIKFLESAAALGKGLFNKASQPKHRQVIAQACEKAPLVVFPSGERRTIPDLADPSDAALMQVFGGMPLFPPESYRSAMVLSVMQQAGLRRFSDPAVFHTAALQVGDNVRICMAMLQHLGRMPEAIKWPSHIFPMLARLPIFPVLPQGSGDELYPPTAQEAPASSARLLVTLDVPCLFQHAAVSWTQVPLLDPGAVGEWPVALRRRFGALKDPPPLDLVSSHLAEVVTRWSRVAAAEASAVKRRQGIVAEHLRCLAAIKSRNHAMQTMVRGRLVGVAFIVLDDGTLVMAADVFQQLHSGGDSDGDEEEPADAEAVGEDEAAGPPGEAAVAGWETARAGGRRGGKGGQAAVDAAGGAEPQRAAKLAKGTTSSAGFGIPWALPGYLRPYRRLLLSFAGPAVNTKEKVPQIRVPEAPNENLVPDFLQASLNQPDLADVAFIVRGEDGTEVPIYAHRIILAATSEHFRTAFTGGFSSTLGADGRVRIELPDWVMSTALLWMLAYLYRGFDANKAQGVALVLEAKLRGDGSLPTDMFGRGRLLRRIFKEAEDDIGEHLCCLMRLSEFYILEHLKAWCESRLQSFLTPDSLVALSTHAYFCNARQLLRLCIYNMRLIYAEFAGHEEWQMLDPNIKELVLADMVPASEASAEQ